MRVTERSLKVGACTADTARCGSGKSLGKATPDCCRGHVRNILAEIADAFAAAGVTWWMDYGTLLGAVRNPLMGHPPGLLPHDKDGDVGFLGNQWPAVREAFGVDGGGAEYVVQRGVNVHYEWRGLLVIHKLPRPSMAPNFSAGDSLKVCLSATNRTNVDLFPWYEDGGEMMFRQCYVAVDRCKGRDFPRSRLFPLTELPYEDLTLPAPHDPEAFLHHRYGPKWQTPITRNNDRRRRKDGWQGPAV